MIKNLNLRNSLSGLVVKAPQLGSMRKRVPSLASLSGLRIWCCWDSTWLWLWCRPAAAALVQPLGTSICCQWGHKKAKKKKNPNLPETVPTLCPCPSVRVTVSFTPSVAGFALCVLIPAPSRLALALLLLSPPALSLFSSLGSLTPVSLASSPLLSCFCFLLPQGL